MARKIKIEPAILKRRERQEARRQINSKPKRKRYLIVCEGEKTEPNYFEALKLALPKGVLEVVDFRIIGEGFNTESLVQKAISLRAKWETESGRTIDKLWVVFDKDSFLSSAFNSAIQLCTNTPKTEAAWSNEAFEIWYLLHFEFYNTGITRDTYKQRIQTNFRNNGLVDFVYSKNRPDMFNLLSKYGNIKLAIKHSKRLEHSYSGIGNFANQNPCTTVYKLVVELFNLEKELADEDTMKLNSDTKLENC
ncbi:RloB family protein [Aquirufa nivalisilvae]|uniref:RloB family protein n=1 Tax=Aquirufa nivalisilvae TaxID=2516557 RepID=UPI001032DEDF|nr:RloB family protein [Aquirufa nivalisilvae]TBH74949.1 RloB domain-containing protein [Aquirufa nivalisilvae]